MSVVLEFVGGPKDGEFVQVPDYFTEYRIVYAPPIDWTVSLDLPAPYAPQVREGRYLRDGRHLRWEGER